MGVKVHPGFAPSNVFVMPEGIQSASPSYLISYEGSAGREVTVTMEHHVGVSTREEADDLLFLQADSTPGEGHVYKYREVSEGRSEFTLGENTGRLTTRPWSHKFLKIGSKVKKWFRSECHIIFLFMLKVKPLMCSAGSKPSTSSSPDHDNPPPPDSPPPDRNLYTVRVYRSPPQTAGDRLVIICVSLYGRLYAKVCACITRC